MTIQERVTAVAVGTLVVGVLATLLVLAGIANVRDLERIHSEAFDSGFRAAQAGAPATANPRTGAFGQEWLDGWIEGSKRYGDGSSVELDARTER